MHGNGMSNQVGKHSLFGQLWESLSSALNGKLQAFREADAGQVSTGPIREQWLLRRTGILS